MDRICAQRGCPRITQERYCQEHASAHEKARGTRQQRGYDRTYDAERRRWKPKVEAGLVNCWRCGQRIHPGTTWHLGHDDDRTKIMGPEHKFCNESAAGKASHGIY